MDRFQQPDRRERMPCVKPDGTLEPMAQAIVRVLITPRTIEGVCEHLRLPLYRVRSTMRELVEAGLVVERDGRYGLTDKGQGRVEEMR
jgi:predicted transcriptional regulator